MSLVKERWSQLLHRECFECLKCLGSAHYALKKQYILAVDTEITQSTYHTENDFFTEAFSSRKRKWALLAINLPIKSHSLTLLVWPPGIPARCVVFLGSLWQDLLSGLRPEGQSSWKVLLGGPENTADVCQCLDSYCPVRSGWCGEGWF